MKAAAFESKYLRSGSLRVVFVMLANVRLAMKKNRSIAAVAIARKLAVRLWWMWKLGLDYGQMVESGSHAG